MVARFVMKSNKKRIIVVLAILTMALVLSCALVACTKGDTGDRGANGTNGQDGIDGKSAYQIWLDNGNTGTEADFLTWLKGKDGTNGLNGKDGKDGTNGTNGQDGINGKSAYQIWLDNGHTGTEADFLTWLKGKDGTNGLNGKDGANGKDGKDGINGKSAYQIWLDNGHTGTEADFLTWLKGKDGANGKDGTGIQSATINNNGELIVTLDDGTIINAGQVVAPEKRLDENNQITFKTFEKTDKTIYGKVSNDTETFYFTDEIELKGGASYSIYTDFDCSNEIISKVVKLNVGDNTFYILEKCGNDSKFYTVTIRRREIYTVSFAVNDGTPLENSTIKIEEDRLVPKDSVPSSPRDGYGLVWDNDFTSPITENTVITATLTAIYSVSENTITGLTDYGKSLTVLNIPSVIDGKLVTSIGDSAFRGCTEFTSITIPDSVTSIGVYAFSGCAGLTSITIPDSVTSLGELAFSNCTGLTSVTIGNGVTSISNQAFSGCSGLTSITIPDSVTSIGTDAFYKCEKLTNIYYTGDIAGWCGTSGHNYIMSSSRTLYIGGKKVEGDLIIPDSVTSIGDGAFRGCKGLTSISGSATNVSTVATQAKPTSFTVNITSGTSIDNSAFSECSGLTSITIPDSVTSIGERAFFGCSKLMAITIPDNVTSIGDGVFRGCTSLASITIPDSVTSIGDLAFFGCSGLTSVTIGNSVTSIGFSVFSGCSGLTSVTIPDSVTSIANCAFEGCTGLTSITIPDSVTSIGNQAFSGCSGLSSVTIGNSVTSIGNWAFDGCSGLTSITIPNSVTSIDDWAFRGCTGLTTVFYVGTEEQWNAIAFGQNIEITSSILYYYSETEPALNSDGTGYAGNYWHYDTDGTTAVIWIYKIDEE